MVATPSLLPFVPKDARATPSGAKDILGAMAIKISHPDLQANAGSVFSDGEFMELLLHLVPLETMDEPGLRIA
jgi:hypothetical protein